ncbi:MAG: SGNH/GDSL hydrolase family protein [Lachnospiraceae bacterium]|nr:SGNH/GDSL hydrolase family protein [Lachnospiraceae bacterium]
MKRQYKMKLLAWGISMTLLLSACGQTENQSSTPVDNISTENSTEQNATENSTEPTEEPAPVVEGLALDTEYLTDEMYERATQFLEGDLTRLAKAMRKAQNGEEITVGVIGGSITEKYSASSYEKCYASHVQKWWEERFPDTKVNFINAGIGGTTSYLGVHRVDEDLLYAEPDVVVVEFSVNDGNDNFFKKSYDNLVRKILFEEQEPAVMLLFTTTEAGYNAQENDSLIGFKYHLPMLSYANAVLPAIEAGEFTWDDISPDDVHPNDRGHAIIGEIMYRYLNDVYAKLDEISEEVTPFNEKAVTKEIYLDAKLLDSDDIEPVSMGSFEKKAVNWYLPNNWYTETGDEAIVFEVEAANIGIAYQRSTDGSYGQYEVYVDGEYAATLDGYFKNGWGSTLQPDEVYLSDEPALHTIEIRKAADSTGDLFAIIALLVS